MLRDQIDYEEFCRRADLNLLRPLHPRRRYLFGPKPSMVPPRVYEALSRPIVGHLDQHCIQVMGDVQQLLKMGFRHERRYHDSDFRHWQRRDGSSCQLR
jgi:hypothetical protein